MGEAREGVLIYLRRAAKEGRDFRGVAYELQAVAAPNIVRPGEPWTADDVRAALAQGDAR